MAWHSFQSVFLPCTLCFLREVSARSTLMRGVTQAEPQEPLLKRGLNYPCLIKSPQIRCHPPSRFDNSDRHMLMCLCASGS